MHTILHHFIIITRILHQFGLMHKLAHFCSRFIKERKEKDPQVDVAVATKFAALPWRLGRKSVIAALKDSLSRLELSSVDLYQLHWFVFFLTLFSPFLPCRRLSSTILRVILSKGCH